MSKKHQAYSQDGATESMLQTPDKFVPFDFEPEEIEPAAEELKPMWENGCKQFESERLKSLAWHYELGKCVMKHYYHVRQERESRCSSMYGERFFQRVADAINAAGTPKPVRWALLFHCWKLAGAYDEEAFADLCQHELITATHAICLGALQPAEFRAEIQAELIENGWCVRELQRAIKEKLGIRRRAGGGRPLKTPRTIKAALVHSIEQAKRFVKANDEIWFGTAFDIPKEVRETPADLLTDELKTQLSEAVERYEEVSRVTQENAQHLRDTLQSVEERMRLQAEYNRRLQDEDDVEDTVIATAG